MGGMNIEKSYMPDKTTQSHRDLIKISAKSFDIIDTNREDGALLMKDFGHAYAAFHGNVECMLLPELGSEVPSMFQKKRKVGNANVLEFRTLAKRYLASYVQNNFSDSGQVRALFDSGFIYSSRHMTDYSGWQKSTFDRRLFFDRMGTIRRTGIDYHNQVLTVGPFFSMDPDEVNSDFCAIGDVYGLCVRGGKVFAPALLPRNTLIRLTSGAMEIRTMSMNNMVLETASGKRLSPGSQKEIRIHVREPQTKPSIEVGEDCYGFVIIRDKVIAWAADGPLSIPASGCVLVVKKTDDNAEVIESLIDTGSVKWLVDESIVEAFQGGPKLVTDGGVVPSAHGMGSFSRSDDDTRCVPATFHKFVESEERAKSIVGFDRAGNLQYLIGANCSAYELSQIAVESGVSEAILADSGGSACAFIGNGALFQNRDQRGTDFAYWDRPTPIAIVLS